MYAFNSEFRNSLGVRRVRWRESAVIMLRRAGASATSLAPLLWPARSPLHYHKLLSAEAAAGNGWRSRYIYGSVEVGSAEIWLRCLISEPEKAIHPIVMQVLKQTVARRLLRQRRKKNIPQMELWKSRSGPEPFWQRRFYDFNVFSEAKTVEKIQYMHHNPAKRGLVTMPELWKLSSYRVYAFGEHGPVKMDWLFPPYAMRQGNGRNFAQPNEDNAEIVSAHPSKTTKSAAPTFGYRNRKPKA